MDDLELGEFAQGYCDGRDADCPEPGPNRSHRYRHSFEIGRAEILKRPIRTAQASRRMAYLAECRDGVA